MCGVFSSMCRTADTRFRSPYVSRSHFRLSLHQPSSLPSSSIRFMSSLLPVSSTRIALTWLVPILRLMPAVSIRCAIACVRFLTPSGNCTSSRFRCVRVLSAFFGCTVRSMCVDIAPSAPFAFSKCKTAYPITVIHFSVNTSPALLPCRMAHGVSKGAASLLLIGGFLAMRALREEKALMSYGFFKAFRWHVRLHPDAFAFPLRLPCLPLPFLRFRLLLPPFRLS